MPCPKKKTSRSKRDMRRSHDHLDTVTSISVCPTNGEYHLSHRAYKAADGAYYYKGKQISLPK